MRIPALLSTFLVAAFNCAVASSPVVIPFKIQRHFAIIVAKIDGTDVPLILNTGDSASVVLQQSVLDRIKAVPIDEINKGLDAKGNLLLAQKFTVSRLQLGDALFTDVFPRVEVHAPTMPAPDVGHKGFLGTGLLKAYEVILDYAHLTMTLVPHTATGTPSERCRGTSVPFGASQAPAEGGTDFGPWQFKWMDMSLPPFFDGVIGHDFFATHVVCIDFPDKRLVIHP
jgi:hypothetical protein